MDKLLTAAGLVSEKTLNSVISLVDDKESEPEERSENSNDLYKIPVRF
jgi:hypothetical protein